MNSSHIWARRLLVAFTLFSPLALAAPVNPPTFSPDSVSARAPLKVTLDSPIADASIYVTLDGSDPTTRDTELDPGSTILLDEPCTLKARVVLADGSSSAVKAGVYTLMPLKGLGATFVEQQVPAVMTPAQVADVEVVCRNIGTTRWEPGKIWLAPRRARDGGVWNVSKVTPKDTVATWKPAAFSFRVTAPSEPGTYNFQWLLQDSEGGSFGEATPVVRVRVVSAEQRPDVAESNPEAAANSRTASTGTQESGKTRGTRGTHSRSETTANEVRWAKVQRFAAEHGVKPGSNLLSLVRALSPSPHSFKALRERGFKQSDTEFEKIIADHPALFRSTRIVRRDEHGRRIIPGWPAIALRL
jgi:Chitobiase/beta-hexosaminidase C-terminal domain